LTLSVTRAKLNRIMRDSRIQFPPRQSMRILAFLSEDARRGCHVACGPDHAVTFSSDATAGAAALRKGGFDAVVLEPELFAQFDFDQIVSAVGDTATPMVLYASLGSATARVVQLAERSIVELVLRGEEDLPLIAHKFARLVTPSVPALLLNRAAPRLRSMPEPLQIAAIGLFGNRPLPRWVNGIVHSSGMGRRSVDRWMYRTGFNGAATLLDAARMARVWEPLVEEKRSLIEIADELGYGRLRPLLAHIRRLVMASPEELGRNVSRSQFAERLAKRMLAR
jgi:hypothetical protein